MGLQTEAITLPLEIVLPNLPGLAKLARVANPVGAFGAAFFYDGNASAGPYEEAMVNEINRSRVKAKGRIPSHLKKHHKKKKGGISNEPAKGPAKGPEDPLPDHLYYALMATAGTPMAQDSMKLVLSGLSGYGNPPSQPTNWYEAGTLFYAVYNDWEKPWKKPR